MYPVGFHMSQIFHHLQAPCVYSLNIFVVFLLLWGVYECAACCLVKLLSNSVYSPKHCVCSPLHYPLYGNIHAKLRGNSAPV